MSKYDDLTAKLREIFQIDRPELDFGIYRIIGARADEINDYLDNRLKARVVESLANAGNVNMEQLKKELADAIKGAEALGVPADNVPKVQELRQRISEQGTGAAEHENAVFSHLLIFFSRYYDKGDFISQRRYKGDTYAIPYAGEEVVLHWANKDQYYTKSGENFANYSFKLANGRNVHFRLVAADTAKDNRKDNDKERCFVLLEQLTRVLVDEEGDEYEEKLEPVEEQHGELLIRFEYRPMPKGTKQDDLVAKAVKTVLADSAVTEQWQELARREPTEKNPQRTLLEKHLTTYTQRNTADYFIHKDLGRFLRSELDFYIKNEVMHLDDVQHAEKFADIEKNLRMIQCLRAIALDLITFLAQLEDFQKKLWLKKKFVVATHYCITLDRVIANAPELLEAIAANEKQWEQWDKLGMLKIPPSPPLTRGESEIPDLFEKSPLIKGDLGGFAVVRTTAYLREHPFLMVDTALFDLGFKHKLLGALDNLDESLDGLLIHGDNFQALNLLQERYREQVKCIHIDPPYNTATSGFAYKNQYKHSSWLAMMECRLNLSYQLLSNESSFVCHIDENEYENLHLLLQNTFTLNAGTIVWDKRNPMNGGQGIALQHEYIVWRTNHAKPIILRNDAVISMIAEAARLIKLDKKVTENVRKKFAAWVNSNSLLSGGEKAYRYIDDEGRIFQSVSLRAPEPRLDEKFHIPLIHPITNKPCPVPPNGFSRTPETLKSMMERGLILFGDDESTQPRQKVFLTEETRRQMPSLIQDAKKGKSEIMPMGINFPYCHPSSLYDQIIGACTHERNELTFDYFAGSGTTGHAVINLNRQDQGQRKYILVEQGEYFDTVLKPRIQKVVYSADWRDGKATTPETGISHAFKVLKIESYEDTLNNLQLKRSEAQQSLLDTLSPDAQDDYLLRYLLNIESQGSILSVDSFRKPFNCTLKVAVDSAGACEERTIDLVETFNYLIGLRVKQIDAHLDRGFVVVTGTLPTGEKALVLWRDCEQVGYDELERVCDKYAINPRDSEFDVVYINGDHNIPSIITGTEQEGGITKTLKIRQIEPEFLSSMFDGE